MQRTLFPLIALVMTLAVVLAPMTPGSRPLPAKKVPHVTKLHGEELSDPYHWLRDKKKPEVIAYLEAENAYTRRTQHLDATAETLYKEALARIQQTDSAVPTPDRGFRLLHPHRRREAVPPSSAARRASPSAEEEILLDGNELASGHKFFSLGSAGVSDDGTLLAYATDVTGFRDYHLSVKDLTTGKLIEDGKRKVNALRLGRRQQDALLRHRGPRQAAAQALSPRRRQRHRRAASTRRRTSCSGCPSAARATGSTCSPPPPARRRRRCAYLPADRPDGRPSGWSCRARTATLLGRPPRRPVLASARTRGRRASAW